MKRILSNKIVLIFIILLSVIVLHYLSALKPLESSIKYIFRPIQSGFSSVAYFIGDQIAAIITRHNYQTLNQKLKQQNVDLWRENNQLKTLAEENKTLKAELKYTQDNPEYTFVSAKVIARSPGQNPSLILINAGKKQNLYPHLPVLVNQGILVGQISSLDQNTSQVTLLSNNQSKVAASFIGLENSKGIIIGQHNQSIKMELIPADILIEQGSMVITSGAETTIPSGYLIGKINQVDRTPNDLFQTASIEPLADYNNLKYVTIPLVKDSLNQQSHN